MDVEHRQLVQLLPLLPLLAELGRTEHITETAELLGLPQSTVSRAIARASAIVGTELVIRDGRGVRLTPAAKALLPHIEAALDEFQTGLDLVRHESEVVRGRIAVSFQHTFGEAMLPLLISAFRSRHPQTAFDLSQGAGTAASRNWPRAPRTWRSRHPSPHQARRIGSAALYREPLRLVVHHRHPLAGRRRARVAEIRQEPFVAMGSGYGMRSLTDALFREAGFRPRIAFESQDSHTVRGLVSAGLGVSILPPGGSAPGRAAPDSHHRRRAPEPTTAGPGGWRFPWIRPWRSARSASRGGSRFRGMPGRCRVRSRALVPRTRAARRAGAPGRLRARTLGRLSRAGAGAPGRCAGAGAVRQVAGWPRGRRKETAVSHVSGDLGVLTVRTGRRGCGGQRPASSPCTTPATGPACACRQPVPAHRFRRSASPAAAAAARRGAVRWWTAG